MGLISTTSPAPAQTVALILVRMPPCTAVGPVCGPHSRLACWLSRCVGGAPGGTSSGRTSTTWPRTRTRRCWPACATTCWTCLPSALRSTGAHSHGVGGRLQVGAAWVCGVRSVSGVLGHSVHHLCVVVCGETALPASVSNRCVPVFLSVVTRYHLSPVPLSLRRRLPNKQARGSGADGGGQRRRGRRLAAASRS
jgi:hypothetical protein